MNSTLNRVVERFRGVYSAINDSPLVLPAEDPLNEAEDHQDIETSLTLTYRQDAWGIDRIVLDTVSNHLPADSKGTKVNVDFRQNGAWIDFKNYDPAKAVEAIRIKDDGAGFDHRLLNVLYSTKVQDPQSVGQFGEGMKMVSAACLRKELPLQFNSRTWNAEPYMQKEIIDEHEIDRLCFSVNTGLDEMKGSTTVFDYPSYDLTEEFKALPENMLAFNTDHKVLYTPGRQFGLGVLYANKIIDMNGGRNGIFVKGVRIKKGLGTGSDVFFVSAGNTDQLFTYDLGLSSLSPDRQIADRTAALSSIGSLLRECNNEAVVTKVLRAATSDPTKSLLEYEALSLGLKEKHPLDDENEYFQGKRKISKDSIDIIFKNEYTKFISGYKDKDISTSKMLSPPNLWYKKFHQMFGENAVLESINLEYNQDAGHIGYNVVKVNPNMSTYLRSVGVKSTIDLFKNGTKYLWADSSELSDAEKAVLDLIPQINKAILGEDMQVNVRVYKGKFTTIEAANDSSKFNSRLGPEVTSELGFYTKVDPDDPKRKKDLIGIKRDRLKNPLDFVHTYIHELGHKMTGAGDYDRPFTDWFVKALTRYVASNIQICPADGQQKIQVPYDPKISLPEVRSRENEN